MLRFCLLGSGSSGNAILVASPAATILIDNGLSYRQLTLRAAAAGERLDDLAAVFVTHEHGDHVNGVGILARKRGVPVYMTEGSRHNLPRTTGKIPTIHCFAAGSAVAIGGLSVQSFSVAHDAADPVSYVVSHDGAKLGVAADLGHASNVVRTRLAGCHGLILESNYCPDMLRQGPYPHSIQQRIRGRHGHLSNRDACSLLAALSHPGLEHVVLVHISAENNCPDLVKRMARQAMNGAAAEIHVASQDQPTPVFELRGETVSAGRSERRERPAMGAPPVELA